MAERALLRVAPNQVIANLWVSELREAGFPVETVQESYAYPNASAPVEIWILDKSLLALPGVEARIDRLLEEPDPEDLPEEFREEPGAETPKRFRLWHVLATVVLVSVVWVLGCGRTTEPKFQFMKGAKQFEVREIKVIEWLKAEGLHGSGFLLDTPFDQAVKQAREELTKLDYYAYDFGDVVQFDKTERVGRIASVGGYKTTRFLDSYITELVTVWPNVQYDQDGNVVDDRNASIIVWAYRPSNAQRIGRVLGL